MVKQPSRAQASAEQQAQACYALNTGWPRIGVCRPSFGGLASVRRVRMKSSQRERIVSARYTASGVLRNLLLKSRYFRLSADACGCVFLEVVYLTAPMPCRMPAMPVAATSLPMANRPTRHRRQRDGRQSERTSLRLSSADSFDYISSLPQEKAGATTSPMRR